MSDKELNEKFGLLINFLAIQIVMTLVVIVLLFSFRMESKAEIGFVHKAVAKNNISAEVKIIREEFQIFKESVPYAPKREERINVEIKGNFNEFGGRGK